VCSKQQISAEALRRSDVEWVCDIKNSGKWRGQVQSEINKLKEENIDLEERISTSNHICSVGEEALSNDDAVECDAVQPESASPIAVTVKRISADVIESPYFTHPT